jgi:hypothetical protein
MGAAMKLRIGIALAAVMVAAAIWFWNSEWLAIDTCLDRGGRWDEQTRVCQH